MEELKNWPTCQLENKLRTLRLETERGNFDDNTIVTILHLMNEINRRQEEQLKRILNP